MALMAFNCMAAFVLGLSSKENNSRENPMKKPLLAISIVFAFSGAAQAQEKIPVLSTQELVTVCKTPASPESRSFCIGYVTAIYDTYLATRNPKMAKSNICIKQPAPKRDEVISGYMQWVQDNPPAASAPASGTFLRFLTVRFPCAR
jgi:hypothetical protein